MWLQRKAVWFFCIKANFICNAIVVLIKRILDENMFCNQCSISHQSECPRHLTISIDSRIGVEGNSKTGILYVNKDACVVHDHGHSYSNSFTLCRGRTLSPHDTIPSCCPPVATGIVLTSWSTGRVGPWWGLLARSPKGVTCGTATENVSQTGPPSVTKVLP